MRKLQQFSNCIIYLLIGNKRVCRQRKYLVILQAGEKKVMKNGAGSSRTLYSKELKEHGHEVVLLFGGAGTSYRRMVEAFTDKLASMYQIKRSGVTQAIWISVPALFRLNRSWKKIRHR